MGRVANFPHDWVFFVKSMVPGHQGSPGNRFVNGPWFIAIRVNLCTYGEIVYKWIPTRDFPYYNRRSVIIIFF